MTAQARKRGLAPLECEDARILILGTLPGDESLRRQQYYAHPQNQFWRILSAVYGETISGDYGERRAFVLRHRLAVWDVLASADRDGSLDFAIKKPEPNEFGPFFACYPEISAIGFNGHCADRLFQRYVAKSNDGDLAHAIRRTILPSTSAAATRPFDEKLAAWRAFLTDVTPSRYRALDVLSR